MVPFLISYHIYTTTLSLFLFLLMTGVKKFWLSLLLFDWLTTLQNGSWMFDRTGNHQETIDYTYILVTDPIMYGRKQSNSTPSLVLNMACTYACEWWSLEAVVSIFHSDWLHFWDDQFCFSLIDFFGLALLTSSSSGRAQRNELWPWNSPTLYNIRWGVGLMNVFNAYLGPIAGLPKIWCKYHWTKHQSRSTIPTVLIDLIYTDLFHNTCGFCGGLLQSIHWAMNLATRPPHPSDFSLVVLTQGKAQHVLWGTWMCGEVALAVGQHSKPKTCH